jgi:hypothetical protein
MSSGAVAPFGHPTDLSPRSLWCTSPSHNPALRIGLLLDSFKMSRFFATVIEDIRASNFAKIELLVCRKAPAVEKTVNHANSMFSKVARRLIDSNLRKHVLYEQYLRLDKRKKPANHPLDLIDCSPLLSDIEAIEVEPIGKKFVQRFPPDALNIIQAKDLDVLIRFGFNILHGDILKSARYGVWSYHHGDNEFYRGGPSHFWDLVADDHERRTRLALGCLLLFYSNSVSGPWHFHPANPISTDVRNARSAGRVFREGSRLLRPSQNCCGRYGRSLALNEITELSRLRYAERRMITVEPRPSHGVCGIHTYNWSGNVELIDGLTTTSLKRVLPDTRRQRENSRIA